MKQHVLDDRVGPIAVLAHFFEIALERLHKFPDLGALLLSVRCVDELTKVVDDLDREGGKIVDEVKRIFYLVSDASGQLTERGELFCLNEATLSGPQLLK